MKPRNELILRAFETTYESAINEDLDYWIQIVKDALYRRSYIEAFDSQEKLQAYVVRWSPSRALAYAYILSLKESTRKLFAQRESQKSLNVLCIGGGAGAEIAALSVFQSSIRSITTVDISNWADVVKPLAVNLGLLNVNMIHGDALEIVPKLDELKNMDLVTCLFTTNELVAESKKGFIELFSSFKNLKKGALVVIVESAGSYSEVQIGTKKFPVHFLVHYTLTRSKPQQFDLVDSVDSEWYRLPQDYNYPCELQNMRYFLRIYKKIS